MLTLCKKFGNALPGLSHAVFYNPNFSWIRSADKIVQMSITLLSEFMQNSTNSCRIHADNSANSCRQHDSKTQHVLEQQHGLKLILVKKTERRQHKFSMDVN